LESARGDILSLSLSSPHFRCHFASLATTSTLEICSANYTISLFGTTNATVICNDGPRLLEEKKRSYKFHEFKPVFICAADIPRQIRGHDISFSFISTVDGGCSSSSFKEGYRVANAITENDYLEYLMQEVPSSTSWFGWPGKFKTCQPSGRLASIGFKALLFLTFSLFWDMYLLVSLTFTSSSRNPAEMRLWWVSGGAVGSLLVFSMLLAGTIHFLYSLEYIVMIRFPSPYDQSLFFMDFMDTFIIWGVYISLGVIVFHYFRFD